MLKMLLSDYKNMTSKWLSLIGVGLLITICLNLYFFNKYSVDDSEIEGLSLNSSAEGGELLVYLQQEDGVEVDFGNPIFPVVQNNKHVFRLKPQRVRNFRIYNSKTNSGAINDLVILKNIGTEKINFSDLEPVRISINELRDDTLYFTSDVNGYFELKRNRVTVAECIQAQAIILTLSAILSVILIFLYQNKYFEVFNRFDYKILVVATFILSIFLPQRFCNIAFIVSFAVLVKDFNYKIFLSNKVGLLFVLYFIYFLANNYFFSTTFNSALLETLLPVFFLPFYLACLPVANYLKLFSVSAFFLGVYLIATSLLDFSIYNSVDCFSFDGFTKYLHPVYFSYLLVFSLMHLELSGDKGIFRVLVYPFILASLIFSGSKLVIAFTIVFFATRFIRNSRYLGYIFIFVVASAIFLFAPTKERFMNISNTESLSILWEDSIRSAKDERLNGLTLRLILWQESLKSLNGIGEVFYGKGVDDSASKVLEERLNKRGVDYGHTKYDPHNQYITTFYKMGLVGLAILVIICIEGIKVSSKKGSELLLWTMFLFLSAMLAESVLQRALGIYFFVTVILLQIFLITNSIHFENSDSRNQGHTQ